MNRIYITLLCLLLASCASVFMPTIQTPYPADLSKQDVTAAVVSALQAYQFSVAVVSPEIGLIVTDWRTVTTPEEEAANALLTALFAGPKRAESYKQRLKLSITADYNKNSLIIIPQKETYTTQYGWNACNLDEDDQILIHHITTDTLSKMNCSTDKIEWIYPAQH